MNKKTVIVLSTLLYIFTGCTAVIVESPETAVRSSGKIKVVSATYGKNCGAKVGNVTAHLVQSCNGLSSCSYSVNHTIIGDPAVGCRKTYEAIYRCKNNTEARNVFVAEEAGFGSIARLSCL